MDMATLQNIVSDVRKTESLLTVKSLEIRESIAEIELSTLEQVSRINFLHNYLINEIQVHHVGLVRNIEEVNGKLLTKLRQDEQFCERHNLKLKEKLAALSGCKMAKKGPNDDDGDDDDDDHDDQDRCQKQVSKSKPSTSSKVDSVAPANSNIARGESSTDEESGDSAVDVKEKCDIDSVTGEEQQELQEELDLVQQRLTSIDPYIISPIRILDGDGLDPDMLPELYICDDRMPDKASTSLEISSNAIEDMYLPNSFESFSSSPNPNYQCYMQPPGTMHGVANGFFIQPPMQYSNRQPPLTMNQDFRSTWQPHSVVRQAVPMWHRHTHHQGIGARQRSQINSHATEDMDRPNSFQPFSSFPNLKYQSHMPPPDRTYRGANGFSSQPPMQHTRGQSAPMMNQDFVSSWQPGVGDRETFQINGQIGQSILPITDQKMFRINLQSESSSEDEEEDRGPTRNVVAKAEGSLMKTSGHKDHTGSPKEDVALKQDEKEKDVNGSDTDSIDHILNPKEDTESRETTQAKMSQSHMHALLLNLKKTKTGGRVKTAKPGLDKEDIFGEREKVPVLTKFDSGASYPGMVKATVETEENEPKKDKNAEKTVTSLETFDYDSCFSKSQVGEKKASGNIEADTNTAETEGVDFNSKSFGDTASLKKLDVDNEFDPAKGLPDLSLQSVNEGSNSNAEVPTVESNEEQRWTVKKKKKKDSVSSNLVKYCKKESKA